jgi:hypothetical protein
MKLDSTFSFDKEGTLQFGQQSLAKALLHASDKANKALKDPNIKKTPHSVTHAGTVSGPRRGPGSSRQS